MQAFASSEAEDKPNEASDADKDRRSPNTQQASDLTHDFPVDSNKKETESEIEENITDGIQFADCSRISKADQIRFQIMQAMLYQGGIPRDVVQNLFSRMPFENGLSEEHLYGFIHHVFHPEGFSRDKLNQYNTFDDAVDLIRRSNRILVVTGAGISVSCGIPDFRSKNGLYERLRDDFPDLPDPTAMFDLSYFKSNPQPFFKFAREIFPGQFEPSISHYFIKMLEKQNKLLRNYTQNIDDLERSAGINRLVQCHGSFASATCLNCHAKYDMQDVKEDVLAQCVAMCKSCHHPSGVIKPDIVFFGEELSDEFNIQLWKDKGKVDLVIVMGSSLTVQPVSHVPFFVDSNVPQILINRESLRRYTPDIELLGNCDEIVAQIALSLGYPFTHIFNKDRDDSSGNVTIPLNVAQRKELNEEDFKGMLDLEEPEAKRRRCSPPMWEGRYVSIDSKLANNKFLFIPPNKSIFPGAEYVYDKDDGTLGKLPKAQQNTVTPSTSGVHSSKSSVSDGAESNMSISPSFGDVYGVSPMSHSVSLSDFELTHHEPSLKRSHSWPVLLNGH